MYCTCYFLSLSLCYLSRKILLIQASQCKVPFLSASADAKPRLDLLWFGSGPEVAALRLTTFLSIFDCLDYFELYGKVEESLLVALCLLTYMMLQVMFKNVLVCNSFFII